MRHFESLIDLFQAFPNEKACIKHLQAIRWQDGAYCPHCGHDKIYEFAKKPLFKCAQCHVNFSIRVGTIFENSKLPLQTWFAAIWLITNHPKGIASTTLAKDLHITQKTAWFVLHRLRHASRVKTFDKPLSGIVEIDAAFVKGRKSPKASRKDGNVGVLGAVERKGRVIARVIPQGIGAPEAQKFIDDVVSPNADMLVTDAHRVFFDAATAAQHQTINHAKEGKTRGIVHTQTIEGVWAQLKRQIFGIHHWVSPKHLQNYVNEMAWRMSRRELNASSRMNALFGHVEGKLTYKDLIA